MTIPMLRSEVKCPLCSKCPPAVQKMLRCGSDQRFFRRGQTIFLQQDPATHFFLLIDGWVKVSRLQASGVETVLRVCASGESFGLTDCLQGSRHESTAVAAGPCLTLAVSRRALEEVMATHPEFVAVLLTESLNRIDTQNDQIESLKAQTGMQRVIAFLLLHARQEGGRWRVDLPFEKTLIAAYLGIKPESFSRALSKLRDEGIRIERETIFFKDRRKLEALVAADPATAWSRVA